MTMLNSKLSFWLQRLKEKNRGKEGNMSIIEGLENLN
jgi:hypothetical protein